MIRIFNHYLHRLSLLQLLFEQGVILLVFLAWAQLQSADRELMALKVLMPFLLLSFSLMLIIGSLGFYQHVHIRTVAQTSGRAMLALLLALPVLFFVSHRLLDSENFVYALTAAVAAILVIRVRVAHSKPMRMLRQRVLIFGTGRHAKSAATALNRSDPNVDLVGYYVGPNETTTEVSGRRLWSRDQSLTDIVVGEQVDVIVVALSERRGGSLPLRELLDCKLQGVRVVDIATHLEQTLGQIRLESVSPGWLIFGDGFRNKTLIRAAIKRLFDILFSTILILLAWPVMLIAGVLILIESGGPVLYWQERVGLNGRLFNVVKFRSMCIDAEKGGTPRWASVGDSRVTRVGRMIRKLRIDELPQLFSVLAGSMSLVGPRPERPFFVNQLTQEIPYFAVRHSVKPGVTGWAQVRYHYGSSVEDAAEKLQYDLYYVKHQSLFLDLIVLFETIGVVLLRKGAQ